MDTANSSGVITHASTRSGDENKPVIPKVPGPRKPSVAAASDDPRPWIPKPPPRRLTVAGVIGRRAGRTVTITRTASGTTGVVSAVAA